jgi:hypothetical protein
MRDRPLLTALAVALGVTASLALTPAATASVPVAPGAPTTASLPAVLPQNVDDPDVVIPWDGQGSRSIVVTGDLWGDVLVVPGDSGRAGVSVRNDGPTAGTLTASIVDVTVHRSPDDPAWIDDLFYDHLTIDGIPVTELEGRRTLVRSVPLAAGETTEIPLVFGFEGWTGNRTGGGLDPSGTVVNPDGVGFREVTFDVDLRIGGDTPDEEPETPGGAPGDATHGAGTGKAETRAGAVGPLAATGGTALSGAPWPLGALALLALAAAAATRALRRRSGATP